MPRKIRRRILIALTVLIALSIGGTFAFRAIESWGDSWFEAADYPALFEQGAWGRYGLPDALPAGAKAVIIFAPAMGFNVMPVRDQYVEVRFMLPPTEAASLLNVAKARAPDSTTLSNYLSILDSFQTAADRDRHTPLPNGFQHTIIKNPSGPNVGGVSINPDTGEVIYWIIEF